MKKSIILLFLLGIIFTSCKKEENIRRFDKKFIRFWTLDVGIGDNQLYNNQAGGDCGWTGDHKMDWVLEKVDLNFRDDQTFYFTVHIKALDHFSFSTSNFWDADAVYVNVQESGRGTWVKDPSQNIITLTYNAWKKNGVNVTESIFTTDASESYTVTDLTKKSITLTLSSGNINCTLYKKKK